MKKLAGPLFLLLAVISCSAPDPEAVDDRLTVYPNPASDYVYLLIRDNGKPYTITVFNVDGKINFQVAVGSGINLNNPARIQLDSEGTYHAVLEIDGKKIHKPILRLKP